MSKKCDKGDKSMSMSMSMSMSGDLIIALKAFQREHTRAEQLERDLEASRQRVKELERDTLLLASKLAETERERLALLARAQAAEAAKDAELMLLISEAFPEMRS